MKNVDTFLRSFQFNAEKENDEHFKIVYLFIQTFWFFLSKPVLLHARTKMILERSIRWGNTVKSKRWGSPKLN